MSKKIEVDIDIPLETFIVIAMMAHKRNITFNKMCTKIIKREIKEQEKQEKQEEIDRYSKRFNKELKELLKSTK